MKTRGIIGQKIVRVAQSRGETLGGMRVTVDYIELENGTRLVTHAYETEAGGPIGDLLRSEQPNAESLGR